MIAAIVRRFIPALFAAACLLAPGTAALAMPQAAAAYDPQGALPLPAPSTQPAGLPPPALDDVKAIAAGGAASCALTQDGTVYCWGLALGLWFLNTHADPTPVQFGGVPVRSISVGKYHACAVTADGGAHCWGSNGNGQLGSPSPSTFIPVEVTGLAGDVAAVGAGADHSCALTTAGGVKCWGGNAYGQLGDGTTTDRTTPVDVAGLATGIQAVSVGYGSTCALTTGGEVKCWGHNVDGELGDGTYSDRTTPVLVAGLSGVTAIAAGGTTNDGLYTGHECALVAPPGAAGDLKCWGRNVDGELGDGTTSPNRSTPVSVVGFAPGEIQAVAAGDGYTCASTTAGAAKCWGNNFAGQLGDGTTAARTAPGLVGSLSSGVQALAAGEAHACAIVGAVTAAAGSPPLGHVQCWGDDSAGELGNYTLAYYPPTVVPAAGSDVQAVAAGPYNTCVLRGGTPDGADAWCWGDNLWGQLGDGTKTSRVVPALVAGLAGRAKAISLGDQHGCALVAGAGPGETTAMCWGRNDDGRLGDGTYTETLKPVAVQGLGGSVFAISAGKDHTCALVGSASTGGGARCWGSNVYVQLGDHTDISRLVPVDVVGLSAGVRAIIAANQYTCALTIGGGVKCWGRGDSGQLGDGASRSRSLPVDVKGLTSGVVAIAAGSESMRTCALTTAGGVLCWGRGVGPEPVAIPALATGVQALEVEANGICAILTGGEVACMDDKGGGPFGGYRTVMDLTPQRTQGLAGPVSAVAMGNSYVCAVSGSSLQCWGSPILGALALSNGWLPVPVITPAAWHFLPAVWYMRPAAQ
jgi:alpha-tubulin suppressor-like RCC1 family protein